jgi:hypothetical protein
LFAFPHRFVSALPHLADIILYILYGLITVITSGSFTFLAYKWMKKRAPAQANESSVELGASARQEPESSPQQSADANTTAGNSCGTSLSWGSTFASQMSETISQRLFLSHRQKENLRRRLFQLVHLLNTH